MLFCLAGAAAEELNLEFRSLEGWEPLRFDDIESYSEYEAVELDGEQVLRIRSDDSASGLILERSFNVFETPVLEFRWRAEKVLEGGDARKKSGDDYPVRIYVTFAYDPDEAGVLTRLKYETAKALYGEYPPLASINYIWANRRHDRRYIQNPFTERAMMMVLDAGERHTGSWRSHRVNVLADYRRAFGEEPPAEASLAVMGDADNTGGAATAYIDYIRVKKSE
jgi:hypothetical protein